MKILVPTLLILVLVSGCSNPFSIRMTADYFPLDEGNRWIYRVEGGISSEAEVNVISYDSLFKVINQGEELYYYRGEGDVSVVRELTKTYQGNNLTFGRIHEPFLFLPFVEGDKWSRNFRLSTIFFGDTVYKHLFISVDSIYITEADLPYGKLSNLYHLRRVRIEDNDTLIQHEWYAPDIGLVKKTLMDDLITWELEEYERTGE